MKKYTRLNLLTLAAIATCSTQAWSTQPIPSNPALSMSSVAEQNQASGSWQETKLDTKGNVTELRYLGAQAKPLVDAEGMSRITYRYDLDANTLEEAYFGINDEPVADANGIHAKTANYDFSGNKIEENNFAPDGKIVINLDKGIYHITRHYDLEGNIDTEAFWGAKGEAILNKVGIHRITNEYNELGQKIATNYFGVDEMPSFDKAGVHRRTRKFDANFNFSESAFFGLKQEPVLDSFGVHRWVAQYDERGERTGMSYFGIDDKPVLSHDGTHSWSKKFDVYGNEEIHANFGLNGEPVIDLKHGYYMRVYHYNELGHQDAELYYGVKGEAIENSSGFYMAKLQYDIDGNCIDVSYFDTHRQPVIRKLSGSYKDKAAFYRSGVFRGHYEYDEFGALATARFYAPTGQLMENEQGVAMMDFTQDSNAPVCYNLSNMKVACEKAIPSE